MSLLGPSDLWWFRKLDWVLTTGNGQVGIFNMTMEAFCNQNVKCNNTINSLNMVIQSIKKLKSRIKPDKRNEEIALFVKGKRTK